MQGHPSRRPVEQQRNGEQEEVEAGDGHVYGTEVDRGTVRGDERRDVERHRSLWNAEKKQKKQNSFHCKTFSLVASVIILRKEVCSTSVNTAHSQTLCF